MGHVPARIHQGLEWKFCDSSSSVANCTMRVAVTGATGFVGGPPLCPPGARADAVEVAMARKSGRAPRGHKGARAWLLPLKRLYNHGLPLAGAPTGLDNTNAIVCGLPTGCAILPAPTFVEKETAALPATKHAPVPGFVMFGSVKSRSCLHDPNSRALRLTSRWIHTPRSGSCVIGQGSHGQGSHLPLEP